MDMLAQPQKRTWSRDHKSERHIERAQQGQSSEPMLTQAPDAHQDVILSWNLAGASDPLDCFLAAQTLGIQNGVSVLIFTHVALDVLVSCVKGVRTPYKCVSVNTTYERAHRPENTDVHHGYVVLYREDIFRVSRWPRFFKPELFLKDASPARPPFYLQLRTEAGTSLDVFAWMCEGDLREGMNSFMKAQSEMKSQGVLSLSHESSPSDGSCGAWRKINAEGTLMSTQPKARMRCIPGLMALQTKMGHAAQVVDLNMGE